MYDAMRGVKVDPKEKSYWRPGYGRDDVFDVHARFLRTKISPAFGAFYDYGTGETVVGEEFGAKDLPWGLAGPLSLEDIRDTMVADGYTKGTIFSVMAVLGVGVQVHNPRNKKSKYPKLTE